MTDKLRYTIINDTIVPPMLFHVKQTLQAKKLQAVMTGKEERYNLDDRNDRNPHVLDGSLSFLDTQGIIRLNDERSSFEILQKHDFMNSRHEVGLLKDLARKTSSNLQAGIDGVDRTKHLWIGNGYESKIILPHLVISENLTGDFSNFSDPQSFSYLLMRQKGLVTSDCELTSQGKELLMQGGYATLNLSYYRVYDSLVELSVGTDHGIYGKAEYGPLGVYREEYLNALGSNGIIKEKILPHIRKLLANPALIKKIHGENSENNQLNILGFGSGGGILETGITDSNPGIRRAIGMDLSDIAVGAATSLAEKDGVTNIEFQTGNILDESRFQKFVQQHPGYQPTGIINFIMHDVDHIGDKNRTNSKKFLGLFAKYFPGCTLLISESFKVPQQVMRDNPRYQPASFKAMHDISGQHLFYEEEFELFMQDQGYSLVTNPTHYSSIPDASGKRWNTIGTYMFKAPAA